MNENIEQVIRDIQESILQSIIIELANATIEHPELMDAPAEVVAELCANVSKATLRIVINALNSK